VITIAYFISPHGFGHAARAAAVMNALHEKDASLRFEIFTRVPRWLFRDSLAGPFAYHSSLTDIGLAQESSLREDVPRTLRHLKEFVPFDRSLVSNLAQYVKRLKCEWLACDIAPLGIAVAQAAGIPSVLIENFTWDWIYAGYVGDDTRFKKYIRYLRDIFDAADYHIQTKPVCDYRAADLVTRPISRKPRTSAKRVREQLGIPQRAKAVLITMGGIPERHAFLDRLTALKHIYFVIPGNSHTARIRDNLILLPHRSGLYHPDLMNASDAVIGKAGYSTVAEAYRAGIPFGYILREKFRESEVMADFIQKQMDGIEISAPQFESGQWLSILPDLLAMPRIERHDPNGADQAASFIVETYTGKQVTR